MLLAVLVALSQVRSYGMPTRFATLSDSRIDESSGIAASQASKSDYYTHNDSGDGPRFFRFDATGVKAVYTLQGINAIDWEDMATASIDGGKWVYLGDIGDNLRIRSQVFVHRVAEPKALGNQTLTNFETYTITYPSGAVNAECLMVRPGTGDLYIVSKVDTGLSKVFKVPKPAGTGSYTAQLIATLQIDTTPKGSSSTSSQRLVTGGAISPDGKWVVLRTLQGALEFRVPANFDQWPTVAPNRVPVASETQGESITYDLAGQNLLTTSEGSPCPVSRGSVSGG